MPLNESFVFASLSSGNLTGGNKDVTEDHVSDTSIDGILSDDASHDSDTIYKDDFVSDDVLPAEDEVLQDDSQDVDELLQDHSIVPTQYRVDIDGTSVFFTVTPLDDVAVLPASVVPSTANYTPQAWQVNLAEHRSLGEHYLMWAQRVMVLHIIGVIILRLVEISLTLPTLTLIMTPNCILIIHTIILRLIMCRFLLVLYLVLLIWFIVICFLIMLVLIQFLRHRLTLPFC